MKREFVKTSNAKLFRSHIMAAEQRGSQEAGLVALMGRPGEGKTRTLQNWSAEVGAAMLTAQVDWTPRRMLIELADKLQVEPVRGFERRMEEMIAAKGIAIVVDEAGFALDNGAACLEKLRGITDKSSTLLVLVFMPRDIARLENPRVAQLASRISTRCEFQKSTLEDVALACSQLAEVPVGPDLVAHIYERTDASMRLVLNAIARIEGAARMRPEDQRTAPMTMASIKGMDLFKGLVRIVRKGAGA